MKYTHLGRTERYVSRPLSPCRHLAGSVRGCV
jgi:hypothetical protein